MRPNGCHPRLILSGLCSILLILPATSALAQNIQFQGSADAHGAVTFIDSPIAVNTPAVIETLGVLVSGGSGTIASEAAIGAHVLSIPAAAFAAMPPVVPLACESSAPPDGSDSGTSGPVSVPGFLVVQGLSCETSAVDGPTSTGAWGTAGAIGASLSGDLVTAESARDSTTSVHALGLVTSRGFAELVQVGLLEGAITADAVRASAVALVRAGDPGAATADPGWEIAGLRVLGREIAVLGGGPVDIAPDTLALLGIVSITAGFESSTIAPDGGRAEAEAEALHIVLESGLEISLGRAKVLAEVVTLPTQVRPTTVGRIKQMFLPTSPPREGLAPRGARY